MKRRRPETKIIPAEIVAEAAEPAFQRIRACMAKAPPLYKDLLADMAKYLLDPDVKMSHLWAGRRLDPSGHTGRLGALLGAPPWSFIRALRVDVAARLLADERIADVSGTQIALEAGFKSYNALNEAFKDRSGGITATAYRRAERDATSMTTGDAGTVTDMIRESLDRVDRLTVLGQIDGALTELDEVAALVAEQDDPAELIAEINARRGFAHHRRGEFLVWELDLDAAYTELEKARAAYEAAGELPAIITRCRKHVETPHDTPARLSEALCGRCAAELKTEAGRTLRDHLNRALEPVPRDLDWFQVCCDPCYRVVWEAISKARLGLVPNAWQAFWLAAYADPIEELPPSLARYIAALHESESLTHQAQGRRLELCRLAAETARELGDSLREAYARCFMGNALRAMGGFAEARAALQAAGGSSRKNRWAAAFLAEIEGKLAAQEGNRQAALDTLETARSLFACLDTHLVGFVIIAEGEIYYYEKNYEAAWRSFEKALSVLDQRREPALTFGLVPLNLAAALTAQGRPEDARFALRRCEFDRAAYPGLAATELFVCGCVALDEHRLEEALEFFRRAATLLESLHRLRDKALASCYSVEAYAGLGNRQNAIQSAAEALGLFRALGCKQDTMEAFSTLRQQLEAAVIDAAAVAVTVRRLARSQGGWLPEPRWARGAEPVISLSDQQSDRHRHEHRS